MKDKADPTKADTKAERYTPAKYAEMVRLALGEIDLDPASCEAANRTIKAKQFYSIADDGLKQIWKGRVFLNPPYSNMGNWVDYLLSSLGDLSVSEAILLANSSTDTEWFHRISSYPWATVHICFVKGRINFNTPDETATINQPTKPSMFVYFGRFSGDFKRVFSKIGCVVEL